MFKVQFPRVDSIGREDFVKTIRDEILPLHFGDKIPCTLVVLDEVQQFIGQDAHMAENVQYLAEDLCSRLDGKFLLVGTGQNALTDTPILQKLMARFRVAVQLSNTDIQTVIRKTILEKKPSGISSIQSKLESAMGEVSRNLEGTDFGFTNDDRKNLVADYPLLPSTRKFWYKILQLADVAGTSGQLRGQLRLVDDSLKAVSELELGQIVPADFIFTQVRSELIQTGQLLNETSNLIQGKKAEGGDAEVEGRILSTVYLLDMVTNGNANTGLKANENTIADLLISNLNENSEAFRNKVKLLVKKLAEENTLMPINDEYKLQTKIGQEWEQEYTRQFVKLNNSGEDEIIRLRRERIVAHFRERMKGINVMQGVSKVVRDFDLWDKPTPPGTESKLHLWLRDGWDENETTVESEIRAAGSHSPLAYAFVKKFRDPELRTEIIKFLASGLAIQKMGLPSTPEGQQARKSMETRLAQANRAIQELVEKISDETTIYLAGGTKVQSGTLKDNIQEALSSIAVRQFSEFHGKADFLNWGQALQAAQAGNPDALKTISYTGEVHQHPVSLEILRFIGNATKSGKDIRNQFMMAPYGWSQDAIDTILIVLRNSQQISSSEVDLKGNKINQATFKREIHILGAKDKIAVKKLFQDAGIHCPPNQDLFPFSNEYLEKLKQLASQIGGEAPRPLPIPLAFIKEIENKESNERLLAILEQRDYLQGAYSDWTEKARLVADREPAWKLLNDLAEHAKTLPELEVLLNEVSAILENRLLLQEPDPVKPLLHAVTEKMVAILNGKKEQFNALYDEKMAALQGNEYFKKISPEDKHRILVHHQLLIKPEIKSLGPEALLHQLQKASLYTWDTKIAALSGQFQSALEEAIRLSAPQAKTFSLPRKTLTSQADIEAYVLALKSELEALLKDSSSIILK